MKIREYNDLKEKAEVEAEDRNGRKGMRHKAEVEAQRKKLQKTNEEQNKIEDRQRSCRRQMEAQNELLFLTEEMVLQAFVSLQKQLLVFY